MPVFDSFRVYFQGEDYIRPLETGYDDVFRDLSLSFEVQELLSRWSFPVPVRALALVFAVTSLYTRECILRFAPSDLGFANRLTSVIFGRCQVDFSDQRFSPVISGALRIRTRVFAGCSVFIPPQSRRVVSSAVLNLGRVQTARRSPPQACVTLVCNPQPVWDGVCRDGYPVSLFYSLFFSWGRSPSDNSRSFVIFSDRVPTSSCPFLRDGFPYHPGLGTRSVRDRIPVSRGGSFPRFSPRSLQGNRSKFSPRSIDGLVDPAIHEIWIVSARLPPLVRDTPGTYPVGGVSSSRLPTLVP